MVMVSVIGDRTADRLAGGRGVDDSILRDFGAAARAGNHLAGFTGADRLVGGQGDDRIASGWCADRLPGHGGSDEFLGGAGEDRIAGDGGADWLVGGAGSDVVLFRAAGESAPGASDRIADFASGIDRIDLSRIDARPGAGDDTFRFGGESGFTGSAGVLRVALQGNGRHMA
ncbi:MAG: M10 family metallopeptidase C-terminal domain-containing protein [Mangrovicoccus sp.]|nr:M10 family metallopeptidase C-terminal domain-containing protein [Mangrovicoccus sp.]